MGESKIREMIRDREDRVDNITWRCISEYQKLSEEFIREFKDKVDWNEISCHQTLSEDFIREFKDKVNWDYISRNQILSKDFINEFKDKIQFRPSAISYDKDIRLFTPCKEGVKKYLSIWKKDQVITWNELLDKYDDRNDIDWLYECLAIRGDN